MQLCFGETSLSGELAILARMKTLITSLLIFSAHESCFDNGICPANDSDLEGEVADC